MGRLTASSIAQNARSPLVWGGVLMYFVVWKLVPGWAFPISLAILAGWAIVASRRRQRWIRLRQELQSFDLTKGPQGRTPLGPLALTLLRVSPLVAYIVFLVALGQLSSSSSAPDVLKHTVLPILVFPLAALAYWLGLYYRDQSDAAPTRGDLAAMEAEIEVQEELRRLQSADETPPTGDSLVDAPRVEGPVASTLLGSRVASTLEDVVDVVEHVRSVSSPLPGEAD